MMFYFWFEILYVFVYCDGMSVGEYDRMLIVFFYFDEYEGLIIWIVFIGYYYFLLFFYVIDVF